MNSKEKLLNDCLNKALIGRDRIKNPNSNKIADFVNKYLSDIKPLLLIDVEKGSFVKLKKLKRGQESLYSLSKKYEVVQVNQYINSNGEIIKKSFVIIDDNGTRRTFRIRTGSKNGEFYYEDYPDIRFNYNDNFILL